MHMYLGLHIDFAWWDTQINPYAAWVFFGQYKMMQKKMKNDWKPGAWALIWEFSTRAIQWMPTWQGLVVFQKVLRSCALDKSSLSNGRVKTNMLFVESDISSNCVVIANIYFYWWKKIFQITREIILEIACGAIFLVFYVCGMLCIGIIAVNILGDDDVFWMMGGQFNLLLYFLPGKHHWLYHGRTGDSEVGSVKHNRDVQLVIWCEQK